MYKEHKIAIVGIAIVIFFLLWFGNGGSEKVIDPNLQQIEKVFDNL